MVKEGRGIAYLKNVPKKHWAISLSNLESKEEIPIFVVVNQ